MVRFTTRSLARRRQGGKPNESALESIIKQYERYIRGGGGEAGHRDDTEQERQLGPEKNRSSSESKTRQSSRLKWQLLEDQQKETDSRLLSFWQLIGEAESTPPNNTRKLEAATGENLPTKSSKSEPNESLRSEVHSHDNVGHRGRARRLCSEASTPKSSQFEE